MANRKNHMLCSFKSKCVYCGKLKGKLPLPRCRARMFRLPKNPKPAQLRKPRCTTAFKATSMKCRGRKRKTRAQLTQERKELLKQIAITVKDSAAPFRRDFKKILLREMERIGRQPTEEFKRAAENAMAPFRKHTKIQVNSDSKGNILPESSGPCQVRLEKSQGKISKESMSNMFKEIVSKSSKISKDVGNDDASQFQNVLNKMKSLANLSAKNSVSKPSQSSEETCCTAKEVSGTPMSSDISPKTSSLNMDSQEKTARSTYYLYPMQNKDDFISVEEKPGEEGTERIFEARPSNKEMNEFLEIFKIAAQQLSQDSKQNYTIHFKTE